MRGAIFFVALAWVAVAPLPAFAEAPSSPAERFGVAGFTRDADAEDFFRSFVAAVVGGRRTTVSRLLFYPTSVAIGSKAHTVSSRREFLRLYDQVFTPCFVRILRDAKAAELWANYRGATMPRGQIWFSPDERGTIGIVTINGPFQGAHTCELAVERAQPEARP